MPRKPRLHVPGGLYHVILRGNDRQAIFFADFDRRRWMRLLRDGIARYRCRIHAYCWMTNHVHMAMQVSDLPLGWLMNWVAAQYAKATNKRINRSGHLFERRYLAKLVDADSYLLQLVRYIHLNPVRARMVEDPAEYVWSSHRTYLGHRGSRLLTVDWVLSYFGQNRSQARQAYARFMSEDEDVPDQLLAGNPSDKRLVGDDSFIDRIDDALAPNPVKPSLDNLIEQYCRLYGVTEAELASPGRTHRHARIRAEIAKTAQEQGSATITETAKRFNRTSAALSMLVSHLRQQQNKSTQ